MNKNRNSSDFSDKIILILSVIAVISVAVFNPFGITEKAAAVSMGINLPGAVPFMIDALGSNGNGGVRDITAQSEKADSEKDGEDTKSVQKSVDLTLVPDDIRANTAKYEAEHKNDKKDGDIKEKTYGKANATSSFGNVLVRNSTETKSINIEKVLKEKPDLSISDKSQPTVLIYHTHTTESFELLDRGWYAQNMKTRSNDPRLNMIRVGDEIEKQLTDAGFTVIHDTKIYDASYSGAYERSRVSVENYLEKYPSIQVTLDVHRDAIHESDGDKIKPVAEINGKKAAQVMIISGAQEGRITDFPDWQYNLRFAVQLQNKAQELYPGLMRPIMFCQRKYNMDLNRNSLLLEFGSDANTLDEAAYSGRLIGKSLSELLKEYVE